MTARGRVVAFGALWLAVTAGVLLAPGCYGRNCEGGVEFFGVDGGGEMLDPDTWVSNPIDGRWLWFPRQRIYYFDVPALGGRVPERIEPYVSASPDPIKLGRDFTVGAGNIALLFGVGPNRVAVRNDTCSDYYLRLVLEAAPFPPEREAGAEPEPEPADAGIDDAAPADAGP